MDLKTAHGYAQSQSKSCGAACTMGLLNAVGELSAMTKTKEVEIWGRLKYGSGPDNPGVDATESSPLKIIGEVGKHVSSAGMVVDITTFQHAMGLNSDLQKIGTGFLAGLQVLAKMGGPLEVVQGWENSISLTTSEVYYLCVILTGGNGVVSAGMHWVLASSLGSDVNLYNPAGGDVTTRTKDSLKSFLQGIGKDTIGSAGDGTGGTQNYVFSGLGIIVKK